MISDVADKLYELEVGVISLSEAEISLTCSPLGFIKYAQRESFLSDIFFIIAVDVTDIFFVYDQWDTSMSDMVERITSDWKFDEDCKKNIESRDKNKNYKKGVK